MARAPDRYRRRRDVEAISALVACVTDEHRVTEPMRAERLFVEWPSLVGGRLAAQTWPTTLAERVLVVEVASSSWLHELRFGQAKFVANLHAGLGGSRLFDEVRFTLAGRRFGPPRRRAPSAHVRRRARRAALVPVPAGPEARAQIEREAARVDDPELRELIIRVRVGHNR